MGISSFYEMVSDIQGFNATSGKVLTLSTRDVVVEYEFLITARINLRRNNCRNLMYNMAAIRL